MIKIAGVCQEEAGGRLVGQSSPRENRALSGTLAHFWAFSSFCFVRCLFVISQSSCEFTFLD